jgi:hypothetical protein
MLWAFDIKIVEEIAEVQNSPDRSGYPAEGFVCRL